MGADIHLRLCALWWAAGLRQEPGGWVFFHYAALGAAVFLLCEAVDRNYVKRNIPRVAYLLLAAAALLLFGTFDGYEETWTNIESKDWGKPDTQLPGYHGFDLELRGQKHTVYHDSRWRWSGAIYWRDFTVYGRNGEPFSSQGPMSTTNKPHGHWTEFSWSDFETHDRWYWYGDEVTEGEWHLRNRK